MPIATRVHFVVACDVCRTHLLDDEEQPMFFRSFDDAQATVRAERWYLLPDSRTVCRTTDAEHQAAVDDALPPAPTLVPDGQLHIDGTGAGA